MSSVEPGDWMQSKGNPTAFLEVLAVAPDGDALIRIDGKEQHTTKAYLLFAWAHIEEDT